MAEAKLLSDVRTRTIPKWDEASKIRATLTPAEYKVAGGRKQCGVLFELNLKTLLSMWVTVQRFEREPLF